MGTRDGQTCHISPTTWFAHDMVWRRRRPTQQEGEPHRGVATTTWYPRWYGPAHTHTQAGYCPLRRRHDRTDLVDARDLLTREVRARHGELEVAVLEELGRHVLQLQADGQRLYCGGTGPAVRLHWGCIAAAAQGSSWHRVSSLSEGANKALHARASLRLTPPARTQAHTHNVQAHMRAHGRLARSEADAGTGLETSMVVICGSCLLILRKTCIEGRCMLRHCTAAAAWYRTHVE